MGVFWNECLNYSSNSRKRWFFLLIICIPSSLFWSLNSLMINTLEQTYRVGQWMVQIHMFLFHYRIVFCIPMRDNKVWVISHPLSAELMNSADVPTAVTPFHTSESFACPLSCSHYGSHSAGDHCMGTTAESRRGSLPSLRWPFSGVGSEEVVKSNCPRWEPVTPISSTAGDLMPPEANLVSWREWAVCTKHGTNSEGNNLNWKSVLNLGLSRYEVRLLLLSFQR